MKRFIIFFTITCLSIPFFSINSFASEYDLGTPQIFYKLQVPTKDSIYDFAHYASGTNTGGWFRLLFYPNGYQHAPGFDESYSLDLVSDKYTADDLEPTYFNSQYRYRAYGIDISKNVLAFIFSGNARNCLLLPGITYKDLYIPTDEQYLKVQFTVDTTKVGTSYDIPSEFASLLTPDSLCFFEVQRDKDYDSPSTVVPFTSVVVSSSSNGRVLTYTYYFNSNGEVFQELRNNSETGLVNLVIRFPYYFGNSSQLENGVFILSNYDFPTSYEIITPGGYSQELEGIQNAIITSNDKILDYYDTITSKDAVIIAHQKRQQDKFESAMDDFIQADQQIKDLANSAVTPDVQASASQALSNVDISGIKNVFANPYIIGLFTLVLGFGFLRLILYGTKEG